LQFHILQFLIPHFQLCQDITTNAIQSSCTAIPVYTYWKNKNYAALINLLVMQNQQTTSTTKTARSPNVIWEEPCRTPIMAENGLTRCVCNANCRRVQSLSSRYTTSLLQYHIDAHGARLMPTEARGNYLPEGRGPALLTRDKDGKTYHGA